MKGGNKLLSIPWVHLRSSENLEPLTRPPRARRFVRTAKSGAFGSRTATTAAAIAAGTGCRLSRLRPGTGDAWRRLETLGDMVEDTWKILEDFHRRSSNLLHCLNLPIMILMCSFPTVRNVRLGSCRKPLSLMECCTFSGLAVSYRRIGGYWVHAGLGSLVNVKLCPSHCFTLICRVGFASRFACIRSVPPRISSGFIEVDQCNCVVKPL